MIERFPCPFCHGHDDDLHEWEYEQPPTDEYPPVIYRICCHKCECNGPTAETSAEALSLWNCDQSAADEAVESRLEKINLKVIVE